MTGTDKPDWDGQFAETDEERSERQAKRRKERARAESAAIEPTKRVPPKPDSYLKKCWNPDACAERGYCICGVAP
jgi:hypothetical protein